MLSQLLGSHPERRNRTASLIFPKCLPRSLVDEVATNDSADQKQTPSYQKSRHKSKTSTAVALSQQNSKGQQELPSPPQGSQNLPLQGSAAPVTQSYTAASPPRPTTAPAPAKKKRKRGWNVDDDDDGQDDAVRHIMKVRTETVAVRCVRDQP